MVLKYMLTFAVCNLVFVNSDSWNDYVNTAVNLGFSKVTIIDSNDNNKVLASSKPEHVPNVWMNGADQVN